MSAPKKIARAEKYRVTAAYDLYWRFAAERQAVFLRRLDGHPAPWSRDPILSAFKFTNAYRASDRTSQYLIQKVIYNERYPTAAAEVVFRIMLFKLFNKISTWERLQDAIGLLTWQGFRYDAYDKALSDMRLAGRRIYSAAYIIPPVGIDRSGVKHRGHLRLIEAIMSGDFLGRLRRSVSLCEVFGLLKEIPSFGDFLSFQLAIDLNYSDIIEHDESTFVVAGPGARDGLAKVFLDAKEASAEVLIAFMMERQEFEFERLGLNFSPLWGRRLQLIDCQNIFCEVSKYTRVSNPELVGVSGRTRIKQSFRPSGPPIQPWYPPKWGINYKIPVFSTAAAFPERKEQS